MNRSQIRKLFDLLKYIRPRDLLRAWKLPVATLAALLYRRTHRNLWIVSEDENEARDNGFWFFRFVKEKHPEQECIYAIRRNSPDFEKVAALGDTVEYGSLRHWILYLSSSVQISSEKSGDPNAAVFYFLQVYGFLKNKRIFLQHGIIINNPEYLHYPETKISRFLCGAYPEYEYIRKHFGYPESHVRYTGLCRFDGLHHFETDPSLILIMPTWRNWLVIRKDKLRRIEQTDRISEADYFTGWRDFLEDDALRKIADEYNVRFIFYPHRHMQQYLGLFPTGLEHVVIAGREHYDVQELLKRAALLITDYSSVFFDMVYMRKPVIFYQFDQESFRKNQYPEGYFHYEDNPFGRSCRMRDDVYSLIRLTIENRFSVSREYLEAHSRFFPLYDTENTARAYEIVKNLSDGN